jgi:filamentous hemagglutinin
LDSTSTVDVLSSSLSGKTVALVAGNDINAQAAQLSSQDAMSLSAGRDINLTTANRTTQDLHASQQRSSSTGLSKAWAVASDAGGPVGGYGNRQFSGNSASADIKTQAVGTTISAGSLQTVSGRDTTLQAATVVADGNITMLAGRNLTIESAQNTELSSSSSANGKSGFIGSWSSPGLGNIKDFGAQATIRTTQQSSQVASLTGDVTLVAGNEYRQTASSVLAAGQAGPLVGGDVNILAKNVTINEAYNTEQTVSMQRSSSSKLGGSASFMGVSTDSLRNIKSTVRAMDDTRGDGRMQVLGALNVAMAGQQAYGAGSTLAGALSGSGPSLTDMSNMGTLSYGVSVTASRNTSQGTSVTTNTTAVGSSVTGANNVNIVATGAGAGSNIHAVGSTIAAGNTVNMAADNDVILEASKNTSLTVGQNSSHGSSVGVTFGAGAQNGFSIQLGVQNGKGSNNQNETTYNATQVSGGNAVNVSTGRNLTLNGATIEGNSVKADVGGDLSITTLQDVSVGQSRQSSSGFGVSLCIPPICYGAVATVSGNVASAKADGIFISPNTQSGIKAGDGGFDVNVKGNTNLTGAVIESTQAAIDAGKNSFHTGGALTMIDLQNVSQSSGSSYAVGGGVSVGVTTDPNAPVTDVKKPPPATGVSAPTLGFGSYSGNNQSSVTRSGISGIAGDQSVRTGDASSAGTLIKDWHTQDIIKNVQAQSVLTQQFSAPAARAVGKFADDATRTYVNASIAADNAEGVLNNPNSTPEQLQQAQQMLDAAHSVMAAEQGNYDAWKEGGVGRVVAHTIVGALGGGADGALGAAGGAMAAPLLDQFTADLPDGLRGAIGAAVAAGIGATVGGSAGAAAAYNEDVNNRQINAQQIKAIKGLANGNDAVQARLTIAACAIDHCADGVPPSHPSYAVLRAMQEEGAEPGYASERALLQQQTQDLVITDAIGGTQTVQTSLFPNYDRTDQGIDAFTSVNGGTRVGGAIQAVGGAGLIVAGSGLCTTGLGCFIGAAGMTMGADQLSAGTAAMATGQTTQTYGEQVATALGLSPGAAALTYGLLSLAPATYEAVVLNQATNALARANAAARGTYVPLDSVEKLPPNWLSTPGAVSIVPTQANADAMASQLALLATQKGANSGAAAIYIAENGSVYVGLSREAGKAVDQYVPLNNYIKSLNSEAGVKYWGTCAELQCYTNAINANSGSIPSGGVIGAAQVGERFGIPAGTVINACPSCSYVNNRLSIGHTNNLGQTIPPGAKP